MSFFKNILIASILIFFSTACEADRCFKKAGDYVEDKIEYESFSAIHVNGVFNIELVQDSVYFIESSGYEQVMRGVEFELKNDTLSCYNYNNCFWRRDFERPDIRIHFKDISNLNVFEASNIYSKDSITDYFQFTVRSNIAEADIIFNSEKIYFYINKTSGGKYIFRGKTGSAFLMNFNTGLFEMAELECKKAKVLNYSIIDMEVNVTEELKVGIFNTGDIKYKGNPEIIIDSLTSSGRPIPLD